MSNWRQTLSWKINTKPLGWLCFQTRLNTHVVVGVLTQDEKSILMAWGKYWKDYTIGNTASLTPQEAIDAYYAAPLSGSFYTLGRTPAAELEPIHFVGVRDFEISEEELRKKGWTNIPYV